MNARPDLSTKVRAVQRIVVALFATVPCGVWTAHGGDADSVRVDTDVRLRVYGQVNTLPASRLDPRNQLGIPRTAVTAEARLDFSAVSGPVRIVFHSRFSGRRRHWKDGVWRGHSETDTEFRVQELRAEGSAGDAWFISVGKEQIQWGPSFLLSTSNPFAASPLLYDPFREPPPAIAGRVQWAPSSQWDLEVFAQDRHLTSASGFSRPPAVALKAGRTVGAWRTALIGSKLEGEDPAIGAYTTCHAGEAWVLHAETGVGRDVFSGTLGASYTTRTQWMLTAEVLHRSGGDRREDLSAIAERRFPGASEAYAAGEAGERSGFWMEEWAHLLPLRKNYVMLQALHPIWRNRLELLLRYDFGLDDGSGRFLAYTARETWGRLRMFAAGTVHHGGRETEFGSVIESQLWVGTEWFF